MAFSFTCEFERIELEFFNMLIEVLLCIICMDQERTMLCLPCRHLQLCEDCSVECKHCPSYRAEIQQYLKVFT